MSAEQYDVGMIGLGVMGSNLVLNMADHGFAVVGYDRSPEKAQALEAQVQGLRIRTADSLADLVKLLTPPRAVVLLVPAGAPVDAVIHELQPLMRPNDIVIDCGNSHYSDTDLRQAALAEHGIHFLGIGISGGEVGARRGPCLMPGGSLEAYERVRPIFEAVAARVDGERSVAYLGAGSAGHYVKMVHNGIEYALMEIIAETYALLKQGLGLSDDELHITFQEWNEAEPNSYLLDITARILQKVDPRTGKRLIDVILDVARQKGTGMWASQDAMKLHLPVPMIDTAVAMRDLSMQETERKAACQLFSGPSEKYQGDQAKFIGKVRDSLYMAMLIAYAQGMSQLAAASRQYGYGLQLATIARIWRGGCIIRAALLDTIMKAYQAQPELTTLLLDDAYARELNDRQGSLRTVLTMAITLGIPVPGLASALGYFDAVRQCWLPANLIQAQRDYFGAHTYERIDERGTFHTEWE